MKIDVFQTILGEPIDVRRLHESSKCLAGAEAHVVEHHVDDVGRAIGGRWSDRECGFGLLGYQGHENGSQGYHDPGRSAPNASDATAPLQP